MSDWNAFLEGSPFAELYEPVTLTGQGSFKAGASFEQRFPKLTELLSSSRLSVLQTDKGVRHLRAWTAPDGEIFGWLCFPPGIEAANLPLHADHRLLLSSFGGIDEYWNTPSSLINNLNGALGIADAAAGFGGNDALFRSVSAGRGPRVHVEPHDYLVFATEANGDQFVYNQKTGAVLLLGFDTGRTNLQHVEGYPDLLYTVNGAPDFRSWVELLADKHIRKIKAAGGS